MVDDVVLTPAGPWEALRLPSSAFPPEPTTSDQQCQVRNCKGSRTVGQTRCLGHVSDAHLDRVLNRAVELGSIDARGVVFTRKRLKRVLDAVASIKSSDGGQYICLLDGASFPSGASLAITYPGAVRFVNATFRGRSSFSGAVFEGPVAFYQANFAGPATFSGAVFKEDLGIQHCVFMGKVTFDGVRARNVVIADSTFESEANFGSINVAGGAHILVGRFAGDVNFTRAEITLGLIFDRVYLAADLSFDDATFAGSVELGVAIGGRTSFANACFAKSARFTNARFGRLTTFSYSTFNDS